jgi:choline-sulfatase
MDNTIIIYSSDHGEQIGEHGLWWKQTFYEDSARVPAIVSWPGQLTAGRSVDAPIDQFDLAATMLDAAGAQQLPQSHGMSVIDLINGPDNTEWKDAVFSEYCMNDSSSGSGMSANLGGADIHARPGGVQNRMVRSGDWKLNYYHGFEPQLFNLAEDPHELDDRAPDPSCKDIRDQMLDRILDGWDPDRIAKRMRVLKAEQELMEQWAKNVDPPDAIRWDLRPEMDYLN